MLDSTIANIALPYIGTDLHISQANLTWIVTGYALAFGGLLLLGGRLGDLYGRRRLFTIGLTTFAIASLLGGLAANEAMLLGSRALQGVGAAMAAPAALALITTTFPAGPARNRAMAAYATMSGVGAAIGLILGGWLTGLDSFVGLDVEGWRMTFLINVPIGLIAAAAVPRVLAESESHPGEMDVPGAITGTLGLLGIVFGLSRAGEEAYGWDHPQTIVALVAGLILLVTFAVIESRVAHPLLPVRIFANRTRATRLRGHDDRPRGDVRDVLLPEPVHPADHGLQPAPGRLRVPAVLVRHRHRCGPGVQPGRPDRRALPGRNRHPARGYRALHVLADPRRRVAEGRAHGPAGRRRGHQLLDPPVPVHRPDGDRHGPGLRPDDPHRGAPRPRGRTPASAPACSTPCSRSAAHWAWRR
ncbi:MDR family MFS transporter [Nocardioides convexus]|uniref:MFS transporter n=1 Tax=Nocardioides convexus TaxID=2712224 RepID=UPI002418727D|nr:MDR family MFS transporter [Nocardioides convexus]